MREKLLAAVAVNTPDGPVILVDMFGGTPSNLSLSLLSRGKIEIITGVNLPMIIEAADSSRRVSIAELISMLIASGQRGHRLSGNHPGNECHRGKVTILCGEHSTPPPGKQALTSGIEPRGSR